MRHASPAVLTVLAVLAVPSVLSSQDVDRQIRANQDRLEAIRRERDQLETELENIRGRARTLAGELNIIDRQKGATGRLVNELDRQIRSMGGALDTVTLDLALAQDALAEKRAILQRRLVDIYKRGPLWTFQVMLAAESFGDLLSRYKYLHLVTQQDQALTIQVEELRDRIATQRRQLLTLRSELGQRRDERSRELDRYLTLERRQERTLLQTRASEREAVARLDALSRDERRLNELIAAMDRARRASAARAAPAGPAGITDRDMGRLDWPVDGDVIYRFGDYRLPNNTVVRQNGVGIKAPIGTPVRAVAAGSVQIAATLGTYGSTVGIDHGGGFYTVYLYLSKLDVAAGQRVTGGEVVGLSGGAASDHGPHLEFQIRGEGGISLDPLNWLRERR